MTDSIVERPKNKSFTFDPFFVRVGDPGFEGLISIGLNRLAEMDAVLRPEFGDAPAAAGDLATSITVVPKGEWNSARRLPIISGTPVAWT